MQLQLHTKRLVLRPLVAGDAPLLYSYRSDPEVSRFQSFRPQNEDDAREFIVRYTSTFNVRGTWFQLGICLRDSTQLIGDIGLHFLATDDQSVEIGFTVAPAHQKSGYAKEAITAVLDYLFETLDKRVVLAEVEPDNAASIGLLRRLGFHRTECSADSRSSQSQSTAQLKYQLARRERQRNVASGSY